MQDQIEQDLKQALKAGDKETVSVLRMVKSNLTNTRIEKGELSDEDVQRVLQKEAKQRRDSIESYQAGGRDDLAAQERRELEIIESYLPKQLSDEELETLVDETIAQTGANSPADMGKVMGALASKTSGQADGGRVAAMVRSKLQ